MKKKEISELRSKSLLEIAKLVENIQLEILKAKANIAVSKEKNLKKVKNLRHELSQALSILREKQILEKEKEGGKIK